MDIFEELHKEHEEVAGLIATLEQKGREDEEKFAAKLAEGEPESLYREFEAAKSKLET